MFFKEWEKGYEEIEGKKMWHEDGLSEEVRRNEKEKEKEKKREEMKRKSLVPVKKMPVSWVK